MMLALSVDSGAGSPLALSDRKPNDGVAAAHDMPVQGLDVSYFQGDIDWRKVAKAGIRFAYIKATEGGDRVDPKFGRNWREAKRAGIARGAYHFMYWCSSAEVQATWFAAHVPNDTASLPPVLDVEWNSHSPTCPGRLPRAKAVAKIRIMLEAMEAHTGKRPIIYTEPKFHHDVLEGQLDDYEFWLRSVAAAPEDKFKSRDWAFWQFTTTGSVPGIAGTVDRDVFNGELADWTRALRDRYATQ